MHVCVLAADGRELLSGELLTDHDVIRREFAHIPRNARYAKSRRPCGMVYLFLTEDLGLDVVVSNPRKTKVIAESKKKTDKVDARVLADLLRINYIAPCYADKEGHG